MFTNVDDIVVVNQQESMTVKSHTMDVELYLGAELLLEAKVHFVVENSLQERNVEFPDRVVYSKPKIELYE